MNCEHDALSSSETDAERGLEIIVQRLGWPENAPEVCVDVAERYPGYYAFWTPDPRPYPGYKPAWGAAPSDRASVEEQPNIYGRTPEELIERLAAMTREQRGA